MPNKIFQKFVFHVIFYLYGCKNVAGIFENDS